MVIFLLLFPVFLFSGEFTATIESSKVNVGKSFTLTLTLKDAKAKGAPYLEPLKTSFTIASQQQMFSSVVLNVSLTSNTTWKIGLVPLKEGEATIPAISLSTDEGTRATEAIKIQVEKASFLAPEEAEEVQLTTYLKNKSPYKSEPFFYTVKLQSSKNLVDIRVQNLTIENALVELFGEPRIYQKKENGVDTGFVEFDYLITPLKSGPLRIPQNLVQGAIPAKRKNVRGLSFVDDMDPFAGMFSDRLKPFALVTEEAIVNVQSPIEGMDPWIPAKSLTIEEVFDAEKVQVGEPITRTFRMAAVGVRSSQLPTITDTQAGGRQFKVYADKPELQDGNKDGNVTSSRLEKFTLLPKQAGDLTLPGFSINWFDTEKNEGAVSVVAPRTLHVLPAETVATPQVIPVQVIEAERDWLLYGVIGALSTLLLASLFWVFRLQRKIRHPIKKEKVIKPKKDKKERLPDLNPT